MEVKFRITPKVSVSPQAIAGVLHLYGIKVVDGLLVAPDRPTYEFCKDALEENLGDDSIEFEEVEA